MILESLGPNDGGFVGGMLPSFPASKKTTIQSTKRLTLEMRAGCAICCFTLESKLIHTVQGGAPSCKWIIIPLTSSIYHPTKTIVNYWTSLFANWTQFRTGAPPDVGICRYLCRWWDAFPTRAVLEWVNSQIPINHSEKPEPGDESSNLWDRGESGCSTGMFHGWRERTERFFFHFSAMKTIRRFFSSWSIVSRRWIPSK